MTRHHHYRRECKHGVVVAECGQSELARPTIVPCPTYCTGSKRPTSHLDHRIPTDPKDDDVAEWAVGGKEILAALWHEMRWHPSLEQALSVLIGRCVREQPHTLTVVPMPYKHIVEGIHYTFQTLEWCPLEAEWIRPGLTFDFQMEAK